MTTENMMTCAYRVLRYAPNLVRDEWLNIGVLLFDPQGRMETRVIESDAEFARVRRLHAAVDLELIRKVESDFSTQLAAFDGDPGAFLAKLDETLSNTLQLSPQRAVLTRDFEGELDRLYRDHVEPPRHALSPAAALSTRSAIRTQANESFRRAGILVKLERNLRVDEFTYAGDPMRVDYAYRRNGTRGFVHALPLARDPAQAKALAFTAEHIRAKIDHCEFSVITEIIPREDNDRHRFVSGLMASQGVSLVPLSQLDRWARELGATLR